MHIDAINSRMPSINVINPFEHFQCGCLAGAIWTENAKYLAGFDEQGDTVNGAKAFVFVVGKWVGLREILDFNDLHKMLCLKSLLWLPFWFAEVTNPVLLKVLRRSNVQLDGFCMMRATLLRCQCNIVHTLFCPVANLCVDLQFIYVSFLVSKFQPSISCVRH